jgi:ATP-binding cassette subfamily B protein
MGGSAATGLPFGGIPSELQSGVDLILATEPVHPDTELSFTQRPSDLERQPLQLTRLVLTYRRWVVEASLLVVVSSLVLQAGPVITELAINHGMVPHHHSVAVVLVAALAYLVLALVGVASQRAQAVVTGRLAARVMHDLRLRVFTHLQRLSLDFFTDEKVGVLISRMTSDIENLQQLVQDGVASFALQGLTMVVITGVLFVTNVELALWTVGMVVPTLLGLSLWFHRASARGYLLARDRIALVLADLSESLYGMRVISATNRQRRNILNHRHVVGAYRDANLVTGRVNAIYGPATVALAIIVQGVLLGIGGDLVLRHQLSVGALVAFTLFVSRFFQPIQLLVQQYTSLQQSRSSITRLRQLLETPPSVDDASDAVDLGPLEGRVEFDHVDFGYDPARPVVRDIDLVIEPGETVAFVGPTGAGKSTLAKLVNRFYDPTAGRVLIDGVDLTTVTQHSLRRQVGVVPQEPFLFSGSLRTNITFARPDATD